MAFKIHVNDPLDPNAMKNLESYEKAEVTSEHYDQDVLVQKIAGYDAIVVRSATKVTKEVIEAGTDLKVIARAGTGLDNVDLNAAKKAGITVVNTPGANSVSVAELTIGLMLGLFRHIPRGTNGLKEGLWEKKKLKGSELFKKTVGIVGFGTIGKQVAERLLAFGCEILAYDVVKDAGGLDVEFVGLEELYQKSDIITIHTPLLDATKGLINGKAFEQMKKGVFIIDAARGGILDEQALFDNIENGKVAGAALDVFDVEPPTDELRKKLIAFDNVVCTPHIGASTYEAQERVGEQIVENLIKALEQL
ncbi:MAG: hydroxypyruvate reductase [Thermotogaceae bacterium]|nr:hydroxypyruvate reductase [Thermotogaceae bacterium]